MWIWWLIIPFAGVLGFIAGVLLYAAWALFKAIVVWLFRVLLDLVRPSVVRGGKS